MIKFCISDFDLQFQAKDVSRAGQFVDLFNLSINEFSTSIGSNVDLEITNKNITLAVNSNSTGASDIHTDFDLSLNFPGTLHLIFCRFFHCHHKMGEWIQTGSA